MVRRKDSLCYVEFIRGKYSLHNKEYIVKLFQSMTPTERDRIRNSDFDALWYAFWQADCNKNYMKEYQNAKEKFSKLRTGGMVWNPWSIGLYAYSNTNVHMHDSLDSLDSLNSTNNENGDRNISEPNDDGREDEHRHSNTPFDMGYLLDHTHAQYDETEWGFPKGRRNINESDLSCALREFSEETGFSPDALQLWPGSSTSTKQQVPRLEEEMVRPSASQEPLEEVFTGCNNIRYKHVYFVAQANHEEQADLPDFSACDAHDVVDNMQAREISQVAWLSFDAAMQRIRTHNSERRELFAMLHQQVVSSAPPTPYTALVVDVVDVVEDIVDVVEDIVGDQGF
jgi:8-oxo-dGTP pyrophosphatase MutT (NUDIX family)